jgi:similar to stage IV sporulation protein
VVFVTDWFWRWRHGWVEFLLEGARAERVVSQLALQGHRLWNVRRYGSVVKGIVSLEAQSALQEQARQAVVDLQWGRRGGLPMRVDDWQRRPVRVLSWLVAAVFLVWAMEHIWVVDVLAPQLPAGQRQEILLQARRAGLRPGVWRSQVDLTRVRHQLLSHLPAYAWVGVRIHGMVADVRVIPLKRPAPPHRFPKLVASQAGTVTAVYVYMGAADVAVGETVSRGQVLISGVVTADRDDQGHGAQSLVTPAEGVVMADVRYRVRVFQPFLWRHWEPTGKSYRRRLWIIDQRYLWQVPSWRPLPFSHYQTHQTVSAVKWAGVTLPLEQVIVVYNEDQLATNRLSSAQALLRAKAVAERRMGQMARGRGQVVKRILQSHTTTQGVWVTLTWTVNQNIAQAP